MSGALVELTVHLGERDRTSDAFVADWVLDAFAAEGLAASALLRGVEGFGAHHARRTDRLLSLSEDLPVVAVAVDRPARIEAALSRIEALPFSGPATTARAAEPGSLIEPGEHVKLSAYLARGMRVAGRPAYERAVELLHRARVGGATVALGVDGTVGGERQRGRFFSANAEVPAIVVAIGEGESVAGALPELDAMAAQRLLTAKPVSVLKRDGELLEPFPESVASSDLIKLTLYASEQNHVHGRPVHVEAVEQLRRAGAAGATALRGVWGYHGDHRPHGEALWAVRRRVPTVTETIDTTAAARRWFELLDRLTPERGLITAEAVASSRQ